MPKKGERKPESELSQTYASIRMRKLREKRRLENEQKYLQENRVNSKHYNYKWKDIQEAKPDYSSDPSYEELQKKKQEEKEAQQNNSDINSNNDEDNNIDVSVKLPDIDDVLDKDMINEALDEVKKEVEEELEKGKNYEKNKKRRDKMKQMKKGNKIKEATKGSPAKHDEPLNEDVD